MKSSARVLILHSDIATRHIISTHTPCTFNTRLLHPYHRCFIMNSLRPPSYMPHVFPDIPKENWNTYFGSDQQSNLLNYLVAFAAAEISEQSSVRYCFPTTAGVHSRVAADPGHPIYVSLEWTRQSRAIRDEYGRPMDKILLSLVKFENIRFTSSLTPGAPGVPAKSILRFFHDFLPSYCHSMSFTDCHFETADAFNELSGIRPKDGSQGHHPPASIQGLKSTVGSGWGWGNIPQSLSGFSEELPERWCNFSNINLTSWTQGIYFLSRLSRLQGSRLTNLWLMIPDNVNPHSLKTMLSNFLHLGRMDLEICQNEIDHFRSQTGHNQLITPSAPRLEQINVHVVDLQCNEPRIKESQRTEIRRWAIELGRKATWDKVQVLEKKLPRRPKVM
ncbi:hypothetical protein C8Q76DRAFT_758661 [Earliella scabrosa]|nr:hypothetical protein C8Q76DRAFT_758661 [Earliella scabrosa]